jgi:hypothetical protein
VGLHSLETVGEVDRSNLWGWGGGRMDDEDNVVEGRGVAAESLPSQFYFISLARAMSTFDVFGDGTEGESPAPAPAVVPAAPAAASPLAAAAAATASFPPPPENSQSASIVASPSACPPDHQLLLLVILRAFIDRHAPASLNDLAGVAAGASSSSPSHPSSSSSSSSSSQPAAAARIRAALGEVNVVTKLLSITVKKAASDPVSASRALELWARLRAASLRVIADTWGWMEEHKTWPHVAWREAYVMAQVAAAIGTAAAGSGRMPSRPSSAVSVTTVRLQDAEEAMRAVDLALIMGAPREEISGAVDLIEHLVGVRGEEVEAAEAHEGREESESDEDEEEEDGDGDGGERLLPTIPTLLGPAANLDIPPFDRARAVTRVYAAHGGMTTGPAAGAAAAPGGGGPGSGLLSGEEHPALRAARALTDSSAKPLTVPEFKRRYLKTNTPVVLSGALRDWPALDRWRHLPYLSSAFGHRTIPVEIGQHLSGVWEERPMLLRDFLAQYMAPSVEEWGWGKGKIVVDASAPEGGDGVVAADSAAPTAVRVHPSKIAYLAQHGLADQMPALTEDFDIPLYAGDQIGAVNAWVGTAGTVTRAHYDTYANIFCQAVGYKLVRIYAPSDSPNMYPAAASSSSSAAAASSAAAGGSKPGHSVGASSGAEPGLASSMSAAAAAAAAATVAQGNVSSVDVEHPDLARFPNFAKARHMDAILGPGDALFLPKGWWHYVRALTPSFSVNFWS